MTSLQMLALSNNDLTGALPTSISAISTLADLAIKDNQFTFEHLLYTIQRKPPGTSFSYNRQDSVDVRQRIGTPIGRTLTFTASVDRSPTPASRYQWFKVVNGTTTALQASPSATAFTYTTPPLTLADVGARYYYKITNPAAPALTLVSRMRTLVAFDFVVNTCLAYDQTNPTLLLFSSVPSLSELVDRCLANAAREDSILTELAISKLVEGWASTAYAAYQTRCLSGVSEALRYTYASKEYHYTLYYYDQAGNLAQTVPPEGVKPLTPAQVASFLAGNRTDPPHTLRSRYQYNSLNALVAQHTPDGGESRFFYNEKGQLRLSQNAEQRKNTGQWQTRADKQAYSYTRYDEQGRVREVGELATAQSLAALKDSLASPSFPLAGQGDYQLADRTLTYYDFPKNSLQSVFAQQFLRSRVSWTAVLEKGRPDTVATYYSYDVHGNVRSLLQAVPGLAPKRTDYRYDLVSGKVHYVFYQYGKADEFTHRYHYDADNRLTAVFTSSDGFLWNKEAKYQYYLHGPLARVELGEYRVQGLDHYYTLQGWLKGVNMPYAGDAGKDGSPGSRVGKDAFAYALGYYQGDYQPLNASVTLSDSRDKLWPRLQQTMGHQGLYNGNIAWMVTDLPKVGQLANDRTKGMQGMLYQYDQLNRIVQSRSLTGYQTSSGFGARASGSTGAYDEDYTYDGNGNLLTLQRRDEAAALQDDFRYAYYPGTNKLREVNSTLAGCRVGLGE
jgi:YD repeat-containing protein